MTRHSRITPVKQLARFQCAGSLMVALGLCLADTRPAHYDIHWYGSRQASLTYRRPAASTNHQTHIDQRALKTLPCCAGSQYVARL